MRRFSASAPMPRRFSRARASPTRRSGSSSAPPSPRSSASSPRRSCLRGADLTRLMVTLGVSLMLGELANRNGWLTGGADGLNFSIAPVLGLFPIGFTGQRNAALYSFAVLFILFAIARRLAQSPFGLALAAIRENRLRAGALGIDTSRRIIAIYTVCRGLRRRGRRAAGADDADRLARSLRLPPLGRRHADAHHRRRGISLWRPHRRGGVHRAEGRDFRGDARILGILDRLALVILVLAGRERIARSAPAADRPLRAPRRAPGRRVTAPALEARGLKRNFGALIATDDVSFAIAARRAAGADRPQRRRQDDADQSPDRRDQADRGPGPARGPRRHRISRPARGSGWVSRARSRSISCFPI